MKTTASKSDGRIRRCAVAAFVAAILALLQACSAVPASRPTPDSDSAPADRRAAAGHRDADAAAARSGAAESASGAPESASGAAESTSGAAESASGAATVDPRLPAGEGRAILQSACTGCHDLGGLWAYQGYYDRTRWQGLVDTMIAHGAELNETESRALVDYLAEHFGPGTRR